MLTNILYTKSEILKTTQEIRKTFRTPTHGGMESSPAFAKWKSWHRKIQQDCIKIHLQKLLVSAQRQAHRHICSHRSTVQQSLCRCILPVEDREWKRRCLLFCIPSFIITIMQLARNKESSYYSTGQIVFPVTADAIVNRNQIPAQRTTHVFLHETSFAQ